VGWDHTTLGRVLIDTAKPQDGAPAQSQHNHNHVPMLQDFSSADGFLDAISSAWHREWQRVYSTDRGDTVPFRDAGVDYQVVYTPSIKFWSVFTQGECVTLEVCSRLHYAHGLTASWAGRLPLWPARLPGAVGCTTEHSVCSPRRAQELADNVDLAPV